MNNTHVHPASSQSGWQDGYQAGFSAGFQAGQAASHNNQPQPTPQYHTAPSQPAAYNQSSQYPGKHYQDDNHQTHGKPHHKKKKEGIMDQLGDMFG